MAHFANVREDGVVIEVIVVSNDVCGDKYPESEPIGVDFIRSLGLEGNWIQTSYNGNFRGVFGNPGTKYDSKKDVFVFIGNDLGQIRR